MEKKLLKLKLYSDKLSLKAQSISIILAAGHGKRIKSETPKVVHSVWGVPSVLRVCRAVKEGLNSSNQIIVVGQKIETVAELIGKDSNTVFVYQKIQKGTGNAVQTAVKIIPKHYKGNVYIAPGDIGLVTSELLAEFKKSFLNSSSDMMILTGKYEGPQDLNYYGRILRVPAQDINGESSNNTYHKIIELLQHKDILKLNSKQPYITTYKGRKYSFTRNDLLKNTEFDSGVFAFRFSQLKKYINTLKSENIQSEIYLTDLVKIFNNHGLNVGCFTAENSQFLLGFNNKSTLKKMDSIARKNCYEILKDIVSIEDEENFFVADEVVKDIINLDRKKGPLDIVLGSGCYVSCGVKINKGVSVGINTYLGGNIVLGENVKIGARVQISTYPDQVLKIGKATEIIGGNIIKGNTELGENVRIETGVNITGSNEFPVRIGDRCLIKGTSYVFGSIIEEDNWIQHSILVQQHIKKVKNKDGSLQKIKYILPSPEGISVIKPLPRH